MVRYLETSNCPFVFCPGVEERYSPLMRLSEGIALTGSSKEMIWIPSSGRSS